MICGSGYELVGDLKRAREPFPTSKGLASTPTHILRDSPSPPSTGATVLFINWVIAKHQRCFLVFLFFIVVLAGLPPRKPLALLTTKGDPKKNNINNEMKRVVEEIIRRGDTKIKDLTVEAQNLRRTTEELR